MKNFYGAIYETINLVDGKRYIGKLVFNRINDWYKYLGSGIYLKRAITKYGKENFTKVLLAYAETSKELEQLEEQFIRMLNAVESPEYYNLKYTSIGGDTFTNNPNKEHIRTLHRQNAIGSNNNMFGKPKSAYTIQRIKEANSKPVLIEGVIFNSAREAARQLGIPSGTVFSRLRSKNYKDWVKIEDII